MLTRRYDMLHDGIAFQEINIVIYTNVSDCGSVAYYQYWKENYEYNGTEK
jgi:hypothetical protein